MNVLATTDGSEHSLRILPHAAAFARAIGSGLTLTRVLDPIADCGNEVALTVDEAVGKVSARWKGDLEAALTMRSLVGSGDVIVSKRGEDIAKAILRGASERETTLLAMDTRGHGLVRHALLGSVAMEVLGKTPLPVMLGGAGLLPAVPAGPYRLLVTTDGSQDARAAFGPALDWLGRGLRARLIEVYESRVGDRGEVAEVAAIEDRLQAEVGRWPAQASDGFGVPRVVRLGGVDTAILAAAEAYGAHAILMSTHGASVAHHVLAGSVALGVLSRAPMPVILVRPAR